MKKNSATFKKLIITKKNNIYIHFHAEKKNQEVSQNKSESI